MTTIHFGELLLRLDAPPPERLAQAASLRPTFTGGEFNVAAALARWGVPAAVVSKVPDHDLGAACVEYVRRYGVETRHLLRGGERLGLLFVETGAPPRPGRVVYDRLHTSFRGLDPGEIDWDTILDGATWFHFTGTAPAIGENVRTALREGLVAANDRGVPVSLDVGYRRALWSIEEATTVLRPLLEHVDVLIGSAGDATTFFGIEEPGRASAAILQSRYGLRCVAYAEREERPDGRHRYGAFVRSGNAEYETDGHEFAVVDRIGAGDAFAAGLIRGLLAESPLAATVEFAVAAAVLTHTLPGDLALVDVAEVAALAAGRTTSLHR